ncbi:MAG TPA: helix-turn-helix transcriptional regulator [Leptolyngbyaceae cyanobacterium]
MTKGTKKSNQQGQITLLRELREKTAFTQEAMAVHIGVAVSTYRRWENGQEPAMTRLQWKKYCSAVGVDFNQLPDLMCAELVTN